MGDARPRGGRRPSSPRSLLSRRRPRVGRSPGIVWGKAGSAGRPAHGARTRAPSSSPPAPRERWIRSAVALLYLAVVAVFLTWFIATHFTGYGG